MAQKNYNIELTRMLAFLMVIAIHVTNYFCRAYGEISTGEYLFSLIIDTASRVSVPCFFMITGALLLGRQEPLEKHIRRLTRFFIVLIVWSLIYWVWNTFYMGTDVDLSQILYTPTEAHLWYLYAMIPIYCVMPFFQVMCRHMDERLERAFLILITAAAIVNYIVSLQKEEVYYDLPIIGDRIYSYYIFIGYYIAKYQKNVRLSQRAAALICTVCLLAAFVLTWGISTLSQTHYERVLEYGDPLIALAGASFFLFMLRIRGENYVPSVRKKKAVDLICGCSFGIYLIHILFLDNYKKYMEPTDLTAWIAVPLLIASIATVSFLCVWLLRKCSLGRHLT